MALQVAEQMSDYLLSGAISNAVNFPSITAEEAPKLRPFIELAEKLGSFAGQLTETGILKVQITYEGHVAEMKIKGDHFGLCCRVCCGRCWARSMSSPRLSSPRSAAW